MPFIPIIFSFLGSTIKGFFGFQGDQAKTVQKTIDLLQSINSVDGQCNVAQAQAIQSILTQGSFLEQIWRPILMILLMLIIGCWFFGYIPPHFNDPVSPMMQEVLSTLKIGVAGYVPCRTLEKVIQQVNLGSVLKAIISKKL